MKREYCTLFDAKYMAKGLALYESLSRHSSEAFTLHILAMDRETFWLLDALSLQNVKLHKIETFEAAMGMAQARGNRLWKEYCYTCGSNFMDFLMPECPDGVCYVDSDVRFFSSPDPIFDEVGNSSIGIVPHRFNDADRPRLAINGEYNVGVVLIRNTPVGRRCANEWASKCREWCYVKHDRGRFADQGYLDYFQSDYGSEVCVIQNLGVNLGPWSIGNFAITKRDGDVFVNDDRLACYHFHEYQDESRLTGWPLRPTDIEYIYQPYNEAIKRSRRTIDHAMMALQAERA